jgi:nucleoside-diphosphate-sugar epimerase
LKKKINILVTGSSGFIGINLLSQLSTKKFKITATYNKKKPIKFDNIIYKKINLLDKKKVDLITKNQDIIFHLAGRLGTKKILQNNHLEIMRENMNSAINIANSAYENNVKNFVWLSSSTGYPNRKKLNEENYFEGDSLKDYEPIGLQCRFFEKLLKFYNRISNQKMKIIILRPSIIFGKYDDFDPLTAHFLPSTISDIYNNKIVYLFNKGKIKRDWMYVSDLIEIMLNLVFKKDKKNYEVFNVGSGLKVSNDYIVKKIIKILKKNNSLIKQKTVPKDKFNLSIRHFNLNKINKLNLPKSKNSFDQNLQETINWYIKNEK